MLAEERVRLYSLILLMIILWSANFVIGKYALREIPAMLVVGFRMLVSGLAMIPIYIRYTRRTGSRGWTASDVPLLISLGVLGIGLNQLFFVAGLARTTVAHAAIMIGLTPMLVLVLASAIGLERMNAPRMAGMAIALGGVAVLQVFPSPGRSGTVLGDVLVFVGALTFAVFTVRGKATVGRLGGVVVNTFAYIGTGAAMLPVIVWLSREFSYAEVSVVAWASVIYMALFPSVIAYLIYYYALERIPASRLSAFSYLQPLFATLMAIPTLGEYPTRSLLIGGVLVVCGVFVAERV